MPARTKKNREEIAFGAVTLVLIVAAIVLLIVTVIVLAVAPASGRAGASAYWDNIEGAANHACYHHNLVQQIVYPGAGAAYAAGAVCRDGWSVDLSDTPWWYR